MPYSEITNSDKISIVNSHIRNLQFSKYSVELELISAEAVSFPDIDTIAGLQMRISDIDAQIEVLTEELVNLESN